MVHDTTLVLNTRVGFARTQAWPSKLIRHIADSFMKCNTSDEVDAVRQGVNATVVPAFPNRMQVDWGSIPLIS